MRILPCTCLLVVGEGTDKRKRVVTRGFSELIQQQCDDKASSIDLLTIKCVYVYATCIERVPGPAGHHAASCEVFIGKGSGYSSD